MWHVLCKANQKHFHFPTWIMQQKCYIFLSCLSIGRKMGNAAHRLCFVITMKLQILIVYSVLFSKQEKYFYYNHIINLYSTLGKQWLKSFSRSCVFFLLLLWSRHREGWKFKSCPEKKVWETIYSCRWTCGCFSRPSIGNGFSLVCVLLASTVIGKKGTILSNQKFYNKPAVS